MSYYTYRGLLSKIGRQLSQHDHRQLLETCGLDDEADDIPDARSLLKRLEGKNHLGIDRLGVLKAVLRNFKEFTMLGELMEFEEERKGCKNLLAKISDALDSDERNHLEQIKDICRRRQTSLELDESISNIRTLFEELEKHESLDFCALDFLKKILTEIEREDLVKEIEEYEERQNKNDAGERREAKWYSWGKAAIEKAAQSKFYSLAKVVTDKVAEALFSSDSEEIPEAGGKVQQLPIQEEDSEELESEQEQDLDRIKIHEGTLTSKDVHWNIKLGAVHLAFPRDAVSEPTLITVHRWKPTVLSPPLQEHEALVSNVIEISSNSQEAFKFEAEVKMSFTHSSPGLHGYELVLYKRNDNETGAWKEVTDVEDFKTISDFEEEYQSSQDIPNLHFPVVQADITECATYAVVSRLRLSPEFTITSNGGSFALPKYPSISVTIPENAVTSKTRIPVRLKVQEVPREEFEANEILIGPILRIVCHKPIEFLKPVTITLPVSLGDARHDSPDPTACRVRILFLSSDGEQKEWREITEDLKKPVTFDGTTVKFEVERFSGYSCLIDWLADSSSYQCVIGYLSSLIWTQPQLAVFFAYFPPVDRPDSQDILHLICCPYQLREKVRDEIKNQANVPTPSDSSSHIKMIPGRDKAYVSLKKGIRAIEEVDMEEFYLQFISDELHKVQVPIRVIDDRGLSGVEFFKTPKFEKSTLLCQLYFRLSPLKRKLNRTPVEFFGIPVNDEVLSNPRPEHVLQIGRQFVGSKVYDDLLSRFIKGNINQKQTIQSFYEALAGLKIEIQDKCFEALVKELSNCNEYGFVVDRLQEGKDAVCKSLKTNGDVKKIVLEKAEYRWKNLARELGFIEGRIDAISEEEKDNCEECCYKVLQKWYQENGEMATIRRVMVALTRIGLADINNDIVDCLNLRRQDQM